MTTTSSPRLPLRTRLCALVLAWQVFFVGLLAASPALHAAVHHDGDGNHHHPCAVSLFTHGVTALAAAPLAVAPPVEVASNGRLHLAESIVHAAATLRLPPACGPPQA